MKRTLFLCAVVVVSLGTAGTVQASLLTDYFGVTPTLGQGTYDSRQRQITYSFDLNSLAPTKNTGVVQYQVADWYGSWSKSAINQYTTTWGVHPSGDEPYDVEAMYFGSDASNLYIAVITSFGPPGGYQESRLDNKLVVTGDLALDLGLNGAYGDGFHYDYGININQEKRQSGKDATSGGSAVGQDVYRTANSDWYLGNPSVAATTSHLSNFDPNYKGFSGALLGEAKVNYYEYLFAGGKLENGAATYVIEATIPRSLLVGLAPDGSIGVSWMPGCANDVGQARFTVTPQTNPVPEPGTATLALLGFAGMALLRRRRARPVA